jgi:hypothetical protein
MRYPVVILAAVTIAVGVPQAFAAQSNVNMTVEITNARKANAKLMQEYSWNCRTELLEAGQVKDTRIDLVKYGPDGHLQRSLLNDQSALLPFGFLRRAIAEDRKAELEKYLTALRHLLDQYTLPTEGKVLDFMNQATVTGPNAKGLLEMTGESVVVPGDTFTVWTDERTWQTRRIKVQTLYEGNAVSVDATFTTLSSGLAYMNYAEVTVPAKQLSIQVQDFDYSSTVPISTEAAKPAPPARPQPAAAKPPPPPQPQPATATSAPPPVASPAPPPATAKPLPLGTVVPALPAGCVSTPVGGVAYFYCGGNFYRAVIRGNNLVYETVQP